MPIADLEKTAEVFMLLNATDADLATVKAAIEASPDVVSSTFLDHEAAYREFAAVYACDADTDLVRSIRPQNVPLSFRVLATDHGSAQRLQTSLEVLPGVAMVAGAPRREDSQPEDDRCQPATLPAAGVAPADATAARDAVVGAFTQAWDGASSLVERRAAMQNFADTDRLVQEFDRARPGSRTAMRAVIGDISFSTPERADVLFHLEFGDVSMPLDHGVAVLQDGTWKVDRETVCSVAQRVGVSCAG